MTDSPRYAGLRDYLRVLRAHRVLIVVLTLLAAGAAYAVSKSQDPVYHATASVAFEDETRNLGLLGTSLPPGGAPNQTPAARASTIYRPTVVRRVRSALHTRLSPAELAGSVTAAVDAAGLVDITASATTGDLAARIANEFARQASRYTNENARASFSRAAKKARKKLHKLGTSPSDQQMRALLGGELARLQFLSTNSDPASVVTVASAPGAPGSPRPKRSALIGALVGLLLGLATAFVRDTLDRRLRGSRAVATELDLPVLGHLRTQALGRVVRPTDAAAAELAPDIEGIRIVRQNLEYLSSQRLRSIVVTSAIPEEGKSTVAASLAAAAATAGQRTLLIDGDLRRPALAKRLGLEATPGLTEHVLGDVAPSDVLQEVALAPDEEHGGRLFCVAAGAPVPEPANVFRSERFKAMLRQVASIYDLVVIDSSPLLPVADTRELLTQVDGIILCVRSGRTSREQALAGKAAIGRFPDRPTGVVVTGLKPRDDPEYNTYYAAYSKYLTASGSGSSD